MCRKATDDGPCKVFYPKKCPLGPKFDFQSENIYVSLIAKKDFPIVNQAITDINQLFADVISNK